MSSHPIQTTAADVLQLFRESARAREYFQKWRDDPRRQGVHAVVLGHVVRRAYTLTPKAIGDLNKRIDEDSQDRKKGAWPTLDPDALHPLGKIESRRVSKSAGPATKAIADWSPPLAFNAAFHHLLERRGELFTYPEFRRASVTDPLVRELLTDDAWELFAALREEGHEEELLFQAFRWRLGCAYYSFVRELHVFTLLRTRDADLRIHPLADTLFRTDFWSTNGRSVELLIKNDTYKSGSNGRKPPMEIFGGTVFPDSSRIELDPPRKFGRAYLPTFEEIDAHTAPVHRQTDPRPAPATSGRQG